LTGGVNARIERNDKGAGKGDIAAAVERHQPAARERGCEMRLIASADNPGRLSGWDCSEASKQ
jgi:hypothetical protein